ncbi:MAG: serine/threonine protein kinase [Bryobacteraceae bacterium]
MVGKKILHYQLIDKIGAGGMGEIYKGQDTRLNRLVAVKILSPGLSTDPERKRRFFQEAQAASALNHPNIITLYDIVSEGDMQCIVMEYISGKTLRDLTPAGGLAPPQALQYAVQIASALTVAHAAGLIHRDLKPSNIMVTTSGLIKVLDFGLAKWVDSGISGHTGDQSTMEAALTREGSIIGTVSYMSPEQAEGKRVDARSDIFSFGSVLYEMLTGKRAFEGRSGISTLSSILRDDVKPLSEAAPDVPPLLEQIVLRCLAKEPASRWQSMKEIEAALLTLQRQLDPEGHFAPPIPTGPLPVVSSPPPQSFAVEAAASLAAPTAVTSVSIDSDPSIEAAPLPIVAAPANGPTTPATTNTVASKPSLKVGEPRASVATADGGSQPPAGPARGASRSSGTFPRMLLVILGLIGAALVAGAGIGGWYWWKSYRESRNHIATATVPATPPPAPVQEKKSPLGEPPGAQPAETAPAAPAPAADEANKPARPKRTPKPKPESAATTVPPIPTPVAPAPAPAPIATPPPLPPPKPAPKPLIQTTPVMVADALPFVINLDQDVPADAPEGQALKFTVTEPLLVGDKTVIARGSTVTGAVTGESGKKFLGIGKNKLTFRLTQVEAVDGRKLAVRAMSGKNGDGLTIRPFDTGKGAKTKGYAALQGTTYIGYIDGDQMVAAHK